MENDESIYAQVLTFSNFYKDPVARKLLEEVSLEYLKNEDKEYFDKEFSGELDADGYLLKKDGTSSNTLPSMNIDGGKAIEWVIRKVNEKLNP